jgi:DNA-binding CsgD family transcriptional regulator
VRSLPLRFAPCPGEAFDSWVEAYAAWLGVRSRAMLTALGLSTPGVMPFHYTLALRPAEAETAAGASGLSTEQLHAMTLQRYDRHLLRTRTDTRSLISSVWWTRTAGSRYCPHCLAESDGRWPLRWKLTWTFACTRHEIVMLDACPGCGHVPRTRSAAHYESAAPTSCRTCRAPLPGAPTRPATPAVITAQAEIDTLLDDVEAQPPDAPTHTACAAKVTDLAALASWLLRRAEPAEFTRFDAAAPDAFAAYQQTITARTRPATIPPKHAALLAALAAWITELTCGPGKPAIRDLRNLLRRERGPNILPPRGLHRTFYHLSAPIQGRILQALDPDLDHLDRIRYRSPIPTAHLPEARDTTYRVRHLPQQLWPEWTIRLLPPTGHNATPFRAAITDLVLLAGHPGRRAAEVTAHLHPGTGIRLANTARALARDGHDHVFAAICRLADYLDAHGSAIDYTRRRQAITTPAIDHETWRRLAFTAAAHPGQHTRLLQAQRYLHEVLTGADLTDPRCILALRSARDRRHYLDFVISLTTPLREHLAAHAQTHLQKLGIDEPLTWEPPHELAQGLHLPGREFTDLDREHLRRLVTDQHHSPEAAARILDTGIEHVRLALERLPRPARTWGTKAAPTAYRTRTRAEALLTREFLEHEYLAAGKPLHQIADENDLHRRTVTAAVHNAGIPIRAANQYPGMVDPEWLRAQYLEAKRSFQQIAEELGTSRMTVTRTAKALGIPARPQGVTSRPELLQTLPRDIPADIKAAVEGALHGWQRLERFATAMTHPSIAQAATALDIRESLLHRQLQRLEHDIGAPLYHRATATTPLQPTERGTALLRALQEPDIQTLATATTRKTTPNRE